MSDPRDTALASLICERNDHPDAPACDGCYAMAAHLRENGYALAATPEPTLDAAELADAMYEAGRSGLLYDGITNRDEAEVIARLYNAARLHERTEPSPEAGT